MIFPYLCTDSRRDNSISLVPVYSAETRPIGKIGCDDYISSLDIVDAFTIGRSDADKSPRARTSPPPVMRSCGLRGILSCFTLFSPKADHRENSKWHGTCSFRCDRKTVSTDIVYFTAGILYAISRSHRMGTAADVDSGIIGQ